MKAEQKRKKFMDVRNQLAALGQPWAKFMCFIRLHPLLAGGMAAALTLIYVQNAFSNYYYIDKEQLVNNPGDFYNWGEMGRFGLILLKKILGLSWFNPYLAGLLFLITLWMTALAAGYLFYSVDHHLTAPSLFIFMMLFLVYPTYIEQFLFQYQAFEIVSGIFLLLISDWYLVQALREKNAMAFCLSVSLTIISFGIYQSMVPMQLCLYLGIFLMRIYAEKGERKVILSSISCSILHFIAAFGIYEIISKLFFVGSDYLNDQIIWRTGDQRAAFSNILNYIKTVAAMQEVCYTPTYDLCCGIGLAALFILLIRHRSETVWYGLGLLGMILSPFFLTFVTGNGQPYRGQLVLPLTNAVLWMFGIRVLSEEFKGRWKKHLHALLIFAGGVMIFLNITPMMRLLYTRDIVGKADEMTAMMLISELDDFPSVYLGKPVIFIGHRQALTNGACYQSDSEQYGCNTYTIYSVFETDYAHEPYYFFSTHRIVGFFRTLGFQYFQEPASVEIMPSAYKDSEDMAIWPLEGSIKEFDEYIIVKLSAYEF